MALTSQDILMGAGHVYLYPMNSDTWNNYGTASFPSYSDIEAEQYRLGHTLGGSTITYEPTFMSIKDDLGLVGLTGLQTENCTWKSGMLTWSPETLEKVTTTGVYSDDTTNHIRTLNIGGLTQYSQEDYLLRFVHQSNNFRVDIKPEVQSGWEIGFTADNATVVDLTFGCMPMPGQNGMFAHFEQTYTV